MSRRVIVCGGRGFDDCDLIQNELLRLDGEVGPFDVIIHGCCAGVDSQAEIWAATYGRKALGFRADWHQHGRAAGPIRNQRMIDEGRPGLVIAFPGGRGTADMVRRARRAGVEVLRIKRGL